MDLFWGCVRTELFPEAAADGAARTHRGGGGAVHLAGSRWQPRDIVWRCLGALDWGRYSHQCAGWLCEERLVEGAFVPLGGLRYDSEDIFDVDGLTACFDNGDEYDHALERLAAEVSQVAYWNNDIANAADTTAKKPLELDANRHSEIAEGWVPVRTPHGRAILIFDNSD